MRMISRMILAYDKVHQNSIHTKGQKDKYGLLKQRQ